MPRQVNCSPTFFNAFKTLTDRCLDRFASKTVEPDQAFSDVWKALGLRGGVTFTNFHDADMSRPDRILFRRGKTASLRAVQAELIGGENGDGLEFLS